MSCCYFGVLRNLKIWYIIEIIRNFVLVLCFNALMKPGSDISGAMILWCDGKCEL